MAQQLKEGKVCNISHLCVSLLDPALSQIQYNTYFDPVTHVVSFLTDREPLMTSASPREGPVHQEALAR